MKKMMFSCFLAVLVVFGAQAAEKVSWPVWFAFNDSTDVDVVGLRLTIPSGQCEQVTGMDLGLIGRSQYFNGIQINLFRNDVRDQLAGWQIGGYNSAGIGESIGLQTGLWNEAGTFKGIQIGLVNLADYTQGIQVGLINRVEDMHGYQVGLVNVIRGGEVPFCPLLNIGF